MGFKWASSCTWIRFVSAFLLFLPPAFCCSVLRTRSIETSLQCVLCSLFVYDQGCPMYIKPLETTSASGFNAIRSTRREVEVSFCLFPRVHPAISCSRFSAPARRHDVPCPTAHQIPSAPGPWPEPAPRLGSRKSRSQKSPRTPCSSSPPRPSFLAAESPLGRTLRGLLRPVQHQFAGSAAGAGPRLSLRSWRYCQVGAWRRQTREMRRRRRRRRPRRRFSRYSLVVVVGFVVVGPVAADQGTRESRKILSLFQMADS